MRKESMQTKNQKQEFYWHQVPVRHLYFLREARRLLGFALIDSPYAMKRQRTCIECAIGTSIGMPSAYWQSGLSDNSSLWNGPPLLECSRLSPQSISPL